MGLGDLISLIRMGLGDLISLIRMCLGDLNIWHLLDTGACQRMAGVCGKSDFFRTVWKKNYAIMLPAV